MTRGKGIMGIFHQNEPFSKVLVVWGLECKLWLFGGNPKKW